MAFDPSRRLAPPPSLNQDPGTFYASVAVFNRQLYEMLEVGGGITELARVDALASDVAALQVQVMALSARLDQIAALALLTQVVSDPPTKTEVEAVQSAVNAIIGAAGA